MRRLLLALLVIAAPLCSGCTWYELAFGAFGNHYTDAGPSLDAKQQSYNDRVQSYEAK
jgi:hypothetical protein